MTTERGRIINRGAGAFLNPPGHPEHTHSVETDLDYRPENRGGMTLSGAADATWLDGGTRAAARAALAAWVPLPLDAPEVREWISQVLGYFRSCYRNPAAGDRAWHASDMIIDHERDPMTDPAEHAGVNLIRRYYPDYQPTAEDFAAARWGGA